MEEDTTTEKKQITFPEFCEKSFECIFNQNVQLHSSLNDVLKERFQKIEERLEALEENLKQGFLFYTREIMKGLDDANQVLLDHIVSTKSESFPTDTFVNS